jgi:hypothetical protein
VVALAVREPDSPILHLGDTAYGLTSAGSAACRTARTAPGRTPTPVSRITGMHRTSRATIADSNARTRPHRRALAGPGGSGDEQVRAVCRTVNTAPSSQRPTGSAAGPEHAGWAGPGSPPRAHPADNSSTTIPGLAVRTRTRHAEPVRQPPHGQANSAGAYRKPGAPSPSPRTADLNLAKDGRITCLRDGANPAMVSTARQRRR